ncbi:MAG: RnfABCDGE type electron transport complex subunit B [Oscillospiraceae bacterium]|nr:RnfABCDGE type electron transport complex subunit B [Oscillospiraceae bacterium]
MTSILLAAAIVAGIGLLAGVGLAIASVVLHVPVDERVLRLNEALPGVNCGACGYSGCMGYAEAIAGQGVPCNLCTPGGETAAGALAEIMGVQAGKVADRNAVVLCGGTDEACGQRCGYQGEQSCAAAALLYGGPKLCGRGCLGLGDCAALCPQGAITLREGIAWVDPELCHGCSLCVNTCPKGIITMMVARGKALNLCSSRAEGAVVRKQCKAGCIACRLCQRACPTGAITVENNLAQIDLELCTGCGQCLEKCPKGCLVMSN